MNSCAEREANSLSNRITTSSSTPMPASSSALRSSVVSSGGEALGDDDRGRVRVERQDRVGAADDLAVAQVHAVERPDRQAARALLDVVKPGDLHARNPTDALTPPPSRGSATQIGPSSSASTTVPPRLHGDQRAVARAPCLLALERGRPAGTPKDVREPDQRLAVGGVDAPRPDLGAPQRLAVGVAQLGDQRADVGAAGALDLVAAALAVLAPALLEAVDVDEALGHLELLAAAGSLVGAHAVDPDRRVGGRALAHLAGGQRRRVWRDARRSARSRRRDRRSTTGRRSGRVVT